MAEENVDANPADATGAAGPDLNAAPVDAGAIGVTGATGPAETDEQKRISGSQRRIDGLTREKWEERRLRIAAETRTKELEDKLAAASAPAPAAGATGAAAPIVAPAPVNLDNLVNERVAQLRKQEDFNSRCTDLNILGVKEFSDFRTAIDNFNIFGGLGAHPSVVQIAIALPDGHKVLHHLGSNLDEAGRILALPPMLQAMELTKLSAQMKTNHISGAPAPISPLGGGSPNPTVGPDANGDFPDQASFRAWYAKQEKKR